MSFSFGQMIVADPSWEISWQGGRVYHEADFGYFNDSNFSSAALSIQTSRDSNFSQKTAIILVTFSR